jgi:biopolymer transport protein ExbB/TolQ
MMGFSGNGLWQIVAQIDGISKAVLLILLVTSVLCWAIFIGKWILFSIKKRQLNRALQDLRQAQTVDDLLLLVSRQRDTLPSAYLSQNLIYLQSVLKSRSQTLTHDHMQREWERMQSHLDQTLEVALNEQESYMSFLSTSAAVAPLLGLFGTVWGLIHAFVRISELQSADIATVAPGIAEALITTLAGLIVAIPALVMYNVLAQQARHVEQSMMQFADRTGLIIQKILYS